MKRWTEEERKREREREKKERRAKERERKSLSIKGTFAIFQPCLAKLKNWSRHPSLPIFPTPSRVSKSTPATNSIRWGRIKSLRGEGEGWRCAPSFQPTKFSL